MQRMNPPRGMGPMGPGPQVTTCLSVHLPRHLFARACSPLSIVCQSFHTTQLAARGHRGWYDRFFSVHVQPGAAPLCTWQTEWRDSQGGRASGGFELAVPSAEGF